METDINNNILSFINRTPDSLMSGVAQRVKQRRLEKGWTQKILAAKAGVSLPSYRRFESSGEISLRSLVMLAFALDMTDEFGLMEHGSFHRHMTFCQATDLTATILPPYTAKENLLLPIR